MGGGTLQRQFWFLRLNYRGYCAQLTMAESHWEMSTSWRAYVKLLPLKFFTWPQGKHNIPAQQEQEMKKCDTCLKHAHIQSVFKYMYICTCVYVCECIYTVNIFSVSSHVPSSAQTMQKSKWLHVFFSVCVVALKVQLVFSLSNILLQFAVCAQKMSV